MVQIANKSANKLANKSVNKNSSKQNKKSYRNIHGLLLLDKPTGMSSNLALQKARRAYSAAKAGHTGSLDPLASGLLPICFGDYTKFCDHLLLADKQYQVVARLGLRTDSGDAEGKIIAESSADAITLENIEAALDVFRPGYDQLPPMYSAIKQNGKKLYELARKGLQVERKTRAVKFSHITVSSFFKNYLQFDVRCSKGTYIRSLVDDLGQALGCGAHITVLRRTGVGGFNIEKMRTLAGLEQLSGQGDLKDNRSKQDDLKDNRSKQDDLKDNLSKQDDSKTNLSKQDDLKDNLSKQDDLKTNLSKLDSFLQPLQTMFSHLPQLTLSDLKISRLRQGQRLSVANDAPDMLGDISLFNEAGIWQGLLNATGEGRLQVVRIIQSDN